MGSAAGGDFPNGKSRQSQQAEANRKKARKYGHGRAYHQMIPIMYAAGGAAAVFHKKHAEWADKQNKHIVDNR